MAESLLFYLEESPQAAMHFEEEIERAVAEISEYPERYKADSRGNRFKILDRFPFSIVYQVVDDELCIVSIAHQARMPGFWYKRIE